jgi:hypothetical protein
MAHVRFTDLLESGDGRDLTKYTRGYLLDVLDGMWRKDLFAQLSIEDFPPRPIPRRSRRLIRPAIDPNDDSDLDVEEGFFKNGFSSGSTHSD